MVTSDAPAPFLTERLQGFGTTVFTAMSALAAETGAVNLGQGFPDTDGPKEVADAAVAAIRAGHNQYPPLAGLPVLRDAIAHTGAIIAARTSTRPTRSSSPPGPRKRWPPRCSP